MRGRRKLDANLLDALAKAYAARARLFHNGVIASNIDFLIAEIDGISKDAAKWNPRPPGITASAFDRVKAIGALPHQVFAHPTILTARPHLLGYYRNIATISQKGIGQILFSTAAYEKKSRKMASRDVVRLCRTLNSVISAVIDGIPSYSVSMSRKAIYAEIGSQLQGTWANVVGQGASKQVAALLNQYIAEEGLGKRVGPRRFELKNGWKIVFGAEPDVAFLDEGGLIQIAIEIKGSLDIAGAQTRYGEAKKSFAKQLAANPRCQTIYLASCFTDSVIQQIRSDAQVRDWFNLTSILYDEAERKHFLQRLFHIVNTPGL